MIKSITVTNYVGDSLKIELTDAKPEHGLIIQSIEGLGPATATINTTALATNDGSLFNSARLENRNLVVSFLFTEAPTIEHARQRTYKYFPIKRTLKLSIESDNRMIYAIGQVESNEPDVFSEKEGCSISIICPDPFFYSEETHTTIFNGIEPVFEFVYENDSVSEPVTEFGSIENSNERVIYYEGESEVGMTMTIHALDKATNIIIYNLLTREHITIDTDRLEQLTGQGIVMGDDIIISTVRGEKSAFLLRMGQYTNIMNCISRDSTWFQLRKGDNVLAYVAETGSEALQFKIDNKILYEGA